MFQIIFIGRESSKNYYKRPRIWQKWDIGVTGYGWTSSFKNLAGRVKKELQGAEIAIVRMSSHALNISTDDVLAPSSGNLFQYGTARTLRANWWHRMQHRCWCILKVRPQSLERVGAAKTMLHRKSKRPRAILYIQVRSPWSLLRPWGKRRSLGLLIKLACLVYNIFVQLIVNTFRSVKSLRALWGFFKITCSLRIYVGFILDFFFSIKIHQTSLRSKDWAHWMLLMNGKHED